MELNSVIVDVHENRSFNGAAAGGTDEAGGSQSPLLSASTTPDQYSSTPDQYSSSSSPANSPLFAAASSVVVVVVGQETADQADRSSVSSRGPNISACKREQKLKSLKESIPHKMELEKLHKSDRQHQKEGSWHKKSGRRLSKELYVIVSWYALLQSALFAAVAQTTMFTCEDWWGPVGIAGMVTLGTFGSALDKLRRMGQEQQDVLKFQARQNAVYDKIEQLYLHGSACNLDALGQPSHDHVFNDSLLCVFSPQGLLVLGFLVGFSALIIISCLRMLCDPCKCH